MKALFVDNDPSIFVAESPARARLRTYAERVGEIYAISRGPKDAVAEDDGPLHLYPVHAGKFWHLFALGDLARRIIKEKGIEVVSAQDPFEHGLVALLATLGTKAKLHVQLHTDMRSPYFRAESPKNRARIMIAHFVLPYASGIRVVSERVKQSLMRAYGRLIVTPAVIPIAVSPDVPPRMPLSGRSFMFTLVTVCRLEPEKRIEDVLAALVLIRRKYPEAGLFVIGDGTRRRPLMLRAEELGLGDHVVFLGWRADALALIQSAQAFVNASAYEGYGVSLIEAALAGVPIVTTNVGIVGEVLLPEEDSLVVPVADVYALAAAILRLIEKSDLGPALAESARTKAHAHVEAFSDQPELIAADLFAAAGETY